jgi:hypothetical protein
VAREVRLPQLKRWHPEDVAVACVVAVGILLGLSRVNHFGASWDEAQDFAYARESLRAYRSQVPDWSALGEGDYVELHGPAYLMASEWVAEGLARLRPAWSLLDARHFNNHVIFLAGLIALYVLVRRLAGRRAALLALALMGTQPLLLGHSFINQKDTPFMALFMATIAAGFMFAMGPAGTTTAGPDAARFIPRPEQSLWAAATRDWQRASRARKLVFCLVLLVTVAVVLELLVLNRVLWPALQTAILQAHAGEASPWMNRLFAWMAPGAAQLPAASYVGKAAKAFARLRLLLAILALVPGWLVGRAVFPSVRIPWNSRQTWAGTGRLEAGSAARLLLAGGLLGLTVSVRSLGLFAGGLVTLLMIRRRRPPLVGILAYWAMAALVCYGTWPYLWGDPMGGLADSLKAMAAFPWQGDILYAGSLWDAGATPWHYLPVLIAVQITWPAIPLALSGVVVILRRACPRDMDWTLGGLLFLWMSVPIVAAVVMRSVVYDNARQFLFALPPLFIFAGIGLDGLWTRCRSRVIGAAVVSALLLPGVLGILRLHPYEYTYFSALVGGTQGASRRFETDYWCTSYREAMERIGTVAPPGAVVAVSGPSEAARQVARTDLEIRQINDGTDPVADQVTFGLACTRSNKDAVFYPEYAVTGEVAAGGATLAVIKDFRQPRP